MPGLGKTRDAVRSGQHLDQKRLAQAGRLCSLPVNGLVEFDLGNL
jgi:hypothetical protein